MNTTTLTDIGTVAVSGGAQDGCLQCYVVETGGAQS